MRRFVRYGTVGALATGMHYLVLVLCVEVGHWPAWIGSGFGAAVGAQVAYFGNRRYTFVHRGAIGPSWIKFQATALLGALIGMAVVAVCVRSGLYYLLAQILATGLGLLLTYAINRVWSFR